METNNDMMLKDFFSGQKKEIADFGFSQRVIRNLPEQTDRSWIVGLFAGIGFALALYIGFQTGLIQYAFRLIQIIPQLFILIGALGSSVIMGAAVILMQNRRYRII
jgi:hypothetical protein